MDSVRRGEVKELKHVPQGIQEKKCLPCRIVFLFAVMVFVAVVVFVVYARQKEESLLISVPVTHDQ